MARELPAAEFMTMGGTDLGHSSWMTIDQARIDSFAAATDDHQFIHVDPVAAAATPFGSTIAHGFLTLSLVVPLFHEVAVEPANKVMGINYGIDRLRFINPVRVGSRIRLQATLAEVTERAPGTYLATNDVIMEIEDEDKPALVARLLTLHVTSG
ncbi:MAG: MaoC family dehydratase [Acidimicrobiia bacterium]|nr:MaoC family dehydratase [Acidimicrobiia bacterium]